MTGLEPETLWPGGPVFLQASCAPLTTDTVLLADFVQAGRASRGADLGCASGALMLLLLMKEPSLFMTGLELSDDAVNAALENMCRNGVAERSELICGDFRETVKTLRSGSFDFVVSNPPYFEAKRGKLSPQAERAAARSEIRCSLDDVCSTASRMLRSGGKLFLSYRPEGLNRLMRSMTRHALEPKRLCFVHHASDKAANLVLVEGRKDGNPGLQAEAPLILYGPDGRESAEYRRIYHREKPE